MNRLDEAHGLLSGLLNTFATKQSLAVKWEGMPADPSASTYLREWMLPGQFTGHHLGPTAPNAGPLIYQVDVVTAISGWGQAYAISKAFFGSDYFCRGRSLTNIGSNVTYLDITEYVVNTYYVNDHVTRLVLREGRVGPAMREDTKYVLPMSVTFLAYMTI